MNQQGPPPTLPDEVYQAFVARGIAPIAVLIAKADGDHEFFQVPGHPVVEQNLSRPEASIQRGSNVICTKYGCFKVD